jgi:hypothetical protein
MKGNMNFRFGVFTLIFLSVVFCPVRKFSQSSDRWDKIADYKLSFKHKPGSFLVKIREGDQARLRAFSKLTTLSIGLEVSQIIGQFRFNDPRILQAVKSVGMDRWYIVSGFKPEMEKEMLKELLADQSLEAVEPDYLVFADQVISRDQINSIPQPVAFQTQTFPNDPLFRDQWYLNNTGQFGGKPGADIKALKAWEIWGGSKEDKGVVAIIYSGVDYTHPDLKDNIAVNEGEIPDNGIDDDNNGFVDDDKGWNFVDKNNKVNDGFGGGTFFAGIIAAERNNEIGIAGITKTKIGIVKVVNDEGVSRLSDMIKGIIYAINRKWEIIWNYLTMISYLQSLYDAISLAERSGILFVTAAGNNNINVDTKPVYPASFNLPNIIAVGVTNEKDQFAPPSNYGITSIHLAAPGTNIVSTVPEKKGSYIYSRLSNTAAAAAIVCGAASLLFSYYRSKGMDVNYKVVKEKILLGTEVLETTTFLFISGGRLNLYNLLEDDQIPPAPIEDLTVTNVTSNSISLKWTATGDDGNEGDAARYKIRISTEPIDEDNFEKAIEILGGGPPPKKRGEKMEVTIIGLKKDTLYYVAIKALDNVGNASKISNVVSVKTKMF